MTLKPVTAYTWREQCHQSREARVGSHLRAGTYLENTLLYPDSQIFLCHSSCNWNVAHVFAGVKRRLSCCWRQMASEWKDLLIGMYANVCHLLLCTWEMPLKGMKQLSSTCSTQLLYITLTPYSPLFYILTQYNQLLYSLLFSLTKAYCMLPSNT